MAEAQAAIPQNIKIEKPEARVAYRLALGQETGEALKGVKGQKRKVIAEAAKAVAENDGEKSWEIIRDQAREAQFKAFDWHDTARAKILTDVDSQGENKARNNKEEDALTRVKIKGSIYEIYAQQGYDSSALNGDVRFTDQNGASINISRRNLLVEDIASFILSNDSFAAEIPINSSTKKPDINVLKNIAEGILRDEGFRARFVSSLNTVLDDSDLPDVRELINAKTQAQTTGVEADGLKKKIDGLKSERKGLEQRKKNFETVQIISSTHPVEGTKETKTEVFQRVEARGQQLANEYEIISKIPPSKESYNRLAAIARDPIYIEYTSLLRERERIYGRLKSLGEEISTSETDLAVKNGQRLESSGNEKRITRQRIKQSRSFTASVDSLVIETAREHLFARVKERMETYSECKVKVLTERQELVDKKVQDIILHRWQQWQKGGFGKGEVYRFDKSLTEADIEKFLKEIIPGADSPDGFVKDIVKEGAAISEKRKDEHNGNRNPSKTLTDDELKIFEELMKDPDYAQRQASVVISGLITAHRSDPGVKDNDKSLQKMVARLNSTSWGKKFAAEWINNSAEATQYVREKTGQEVNEESLGKLENIKKNKRSASSALIALLIAFGFGKKLIGG